MKVQAPIAKAVGEIELRKPMPRASHIVLWHKNSGEYWAIRLRHDGS